jgi:hypothetical protein
MSAKKTNTKKSAKKSAVAKKVAAKKVAKVQTNREPNALQIKLLKLFMRPQGATLEDTSAAGANRPALAALRMFERRGYKTSVVKKAGEPTRYLARVKA